MILGLSFTRIGRHLSLAESRVAKLQTLQEVKIISVIASWHRACDPVCHPD